MVPIVAGLLMGAAMGGGIAALQGKDVLKGALMGGVGGALGGAFMPAAGIGGAAGEGVAAAASSANPLAGDIPGLFANTAGGAASGAAGAGGIGAFLGANKYALAGGALGGMLAPGQEPPKPEQGNIREFTYDQGEVNPLFGQPGQTYFTGAGYTPGAVTPVEDYNKANGGIIALAEGGDVDRYTRPIRTVDPAVAAYNAQIMERANQQYNVNLRPGPNQVPGSVGYVAPPIKQQVAKAGDVGGLTFNRETGLFEGTLNPLGGRGSMGMLGGGSGGSYYDGGGGDGDSGDSGDDGGSSDGDGDSGEGSANGGLMRSYAGGGLSSLGNYSDGGQLLKGPGDGVSDSIPARIGNRQPARLADGEFVIPARTVSEIGNGSTDAGARQLYKMMDRVQNARKKSIGKGKVAVDSKARKLLPA